MFSSPLLLGFDQLERTLERLAKNAEGYPPYNIERIGDNGLRITLAVAGFTSDDLAIELVENQLTVRGKQTDDTDRVYLHRGIAARQFQRAFMLADGIEVIGRATRQRAAVDRPRAAASRTAHPNHPHRLPATTRPHDNTIDITARRTRPALTAAKEVAMENKPTRLHAARGRRLPQPRRTNRSPTSSRSTCPTVRMRSASSRPTASQWPRRRRSRSRRH